MAYNDDKFSDALVPYLEKLDRRLESIDSKLDEFRQETERRLAVLEERNSSERLLIIEKRLSDGEKFQATIKVYISIAAGLSAIAVGAILRIFKIG